MGTTSFDPRYPIIPHIPFDVLLFTFHFLAFHFLTDPVFKVALLPGAHGQRSGGHVFANGRTAADIGAFANRDRGHELAVAANERAVLDGGQVLLLSVVVARNRAGADVDAFADDRVAQVRQMAGLGPLAED